MIFWAWLETTWWPEILVYGPAAGVGVAWLVQRWRTGR
jgi:hypothetical protein